MIDTVLQRFGVTSAEQIGHGGDATVYALGPDRVLRVLHSPDSPLARIAAFYDELAGQDPGFALPRVLEHGEIDGTAYSVDRLIPGRPLIDVLPELTGERRQRALDSYLDSADAIGRLRIERPFYGEVLADPPLQRSTWTEFLLDRAEAALAISGGRLAADIRRFGDVIATVRRRIAALPEHVDRRLVHGDYFPGNVMIGDDLKVSGVIDFGTLTVIGDPAMDVASTTGVRSGRRGVSHRARGPRPRIRLRRTYPGVPRVHHAAAGAVCRARRSAAVRLVRALTAVRRRGVALRYHVRAGM